MGIDWMVVGIEGGVMFDFKIWDWMILVKGFVFYKLGNIGKELVVLGKIVNLCLDMLILSYFWDN